MIRENLKKLLLGAVVTIGVAAVVSEADAGWWGCGYRPVYASYSCWSPCLDYCAVSCCSPCYGPSWYVGCRRGPVRRLLLGPYRWYRGYYGGAYYTSYYGGPCMECGMAPPCACGPVVTSTIEEGSAIISSPAAPAPAPTPAKKPTVETAPSPSDMTPPVTPATPSIPATPSTPTPSTRPVLPPLDTPISPKTSTSTQSTSGILTIYVPAEAKVTINGLPTRSGGSKRQYVSFGLVPGYTYKYEVKAQIVRDGKTVDESRTVVLTAGERLGVAFGFNTPAETVAAN
jgi:uncharacterized protein (TIGR03000 family)